MELPNSKSVKNLLHNNESLRFLEVKQASVIKLLKRECEKLKEIPNHESSLSQKVLRKKEFLKKYTIESKVFFANKVPKSSAESTSKTFKNECKLNRTSNLSEKLKELERRRKEMISLGNSFSISNKTSSQPSIASKQHGKNKSTDELRREMLLKGRELGNRYSQTFKRSKSSSTSLITVDELDRYHRLKAERRELMKYYRKSLKSGDSITDKTRRAYLNLIDETTRLGKILSDKNRRAILGNTCNVISRQNAKKGQDQDFVNEYETVSKRYNNNKLKDEEEVKIKVVSEVNKNVGNSLFVVPCQRQNMDEYPLDKKFGASARRINLEDTSCETLCRSLEVGRDVDNERCDKLSVSQTLGHHVPQKFHDTKKVIHDEGFSYSTLKSSCCSSDMSSLTIVPSEKASELNKSLISNESRGGTEGSVELLRKALQGLAASSFIDDLSFSTSELTTSSITSGVNLDGSQQIPSNDPWKQDHVLVDSKASVSTRSSSKACTQSLHKTSTFTSKDEIFLKVMEARRRKLRGDDSDDDEEEKDDGETSAWSDGDINETVKHIFNFVNE